MRSTLALSRLRPTATLSPQGSLIQLVARRRVLPRPTRRISNCAPSLFVQHFSSRHFKDTPRQVRLGRQSNISLARTNPPTSPTAHRFYTLLPQTLVDAATTGSGLWKVLLVFLAGWGVDEYLNLSTRFTPDLSWTGWPFNDERSKTDAQRTLTQSD